MKGMLDANGYLWVYRRGGLVRQMCPFSPDPGDGRSPKCGDWCPLLREINSAGGKDCVELICANSGEPIELSSDTRPVLDGGMRIPETE